MCDADTYHFGTADFIVMDSLFKKEYESESGKLSENWNQGVLEMLTTHSFFTEYCQKQLQTGKMHNIRHYEKQCADQL